MLNTNKDITYSESVPDSKNRTRVTIIDHRNNDQESNIILERFSSDEMEFLQEAVSRLNKKRTDKKKPQ